MDVQLVMFKADGSRREFSLRQGRTVVGRTNDCDLRIPLSSVSRRQCEFLHEADKLSLRDLGSSNGTYHNHIRVQEVDLAAGDEVAVGPVTFTVVIDGEPAQVEPVRSMVGGAAASAITVDDDSVGSVAAQVDDSGPGAVTASEEEQPKDSSPTPSAEEPSALSDSGGGDDLMDFVEEELDSPTVDMDDPIAALEALADELDDDESK